MIYSDEHKVLIVIKLLEKVGELEGKVSKLSLHNNKQTKISYIYISAF